MRSHYFAYRSFLPEFEAMRRFAESGIDTICFFPGNTVNSLGEPYSQYPAIWRWFDKYDFDSLDRQIRDIINTTAPDQKLICIVDLNSPQWLSRQLSSTHESGDSFTHLTECLANPRWKEHTMGFLKAFLSHCETHHRDRICAYVLACGHTDEWFDHNGEICGLAKEKAYRQWRQKKGLPPRDPPSACKMNEPDYDGLLFDPAKSSSVLEYRRFCNELVGDSICEFASATRKIIRPEVEIGVFYGYVVTRLGAAESGHLAYEKVVHCNDIDFMISPGSYGDRLMGGGGGWLGCSGTETLAGKIHMHECDQRTHTHNRAVTPYFSLPDCHGWKSSKEDLAGIKREFSLALLKRSSMWWFDMWGGFYQESALFETFRVMKQIYDKYIELPSEPTQEVALIVDPDALYYFDQRSSRQNAFASNVRINLNRLGAPFETYCFRDIPNIPEIEKVKLFVFACQWEITPEKAEILKRFVLSRDRMVLWLYAPGLSDGKSLDPERIVQWTGCLPDPAGLSIQPMDGWTSAFLSSPWDLTPAMLKDLARKAGVHLYTDAEVPVYADRHFLAIHSKDGGELEIRLPSVHGEITELFSGKKAGENTSVFKWHFQTPDSVLFKIKE